MNPRLRAAALIGVLWALAFAFGGLNAPGVAYADDPPRVVDLQYNGQRPFDCDACPRYVKLDFFGQTLVCDFAGCTSNACVYYC
jgi:hypothetical protein